MRATLLVTALLVGPAFATLPPPTNEAKAQADAAKAKSEWTDKVAAYKLCVAGDRIAERYRAGLTAEAKLASPRMVTPQCVDPGPFADAKPLEAAGAHSPPGTATTPPNTNATHAEITGGVKK